MKQKITEFIYSHREEMVDTIRQLVEIPSVKGESKPGAPFGKEPRRALDKMLEICRNMGFVTSCHDDVMGTADYSPAGNVALGILGHLDVVPAEPLNWSCPPYQLTRTDGKLLGRGVIDDKGPCVAALYALYCVKELGIPLKKGVRLLFGTDEENGSEDLEIYCRGNKLPPMVFTPVITANSTGAVLTVDMEPNGDITLHCSGRSAHASTPQTGVNAVTALIATLNRLPLREGQQREIIRGLAEKFPFGETDGRSAALKVQDEKSGALTLTFSKFAMRDGKISGCIDIRYPVCVVLEDVVAGLSAALEQAGVHYGRNMEEKPHIVPEDSEFVQKLLRVYSDVEGEPGHCIAIGGGTYVHTVEGGVAFGVERGDTDYHMHGNDEFITEEELLKDAVLFACAIVDICG